MEFNETIKADLEGRIKKLENFIADRGIGSKQLHKLKIYQFESQHNKCVRFCF